MQVTHIVLLQFNSDVTPMEKQSIVNRIRRLREECLWPETSKPYIVSITGGADVSIEGLQNDISHAFVFVFENTEHRDYFVRSDPAHLLLLQGVRSFLAKVQVVDFVDGGVV
ncbi:hypothetical protein AbraIFM66951_001292 [Aspergillus brasiliensis]|uniref:Stress-response A/B barrel domain-containing protein n=1 Tax=Aspergillus brasiliensis TaxID=319629 RepID=A0A9W5Z4D8_9EURO|nr:hypothetical protein AbraCBS73388_004695 [Aspergillus brasiliensis]GKZ49041.1 hypothetical protein AbraIFM66951_001292 [Aspergillus brasiliensis]